MARNRVISAATQALGSHGVIVLTSKPDSDGGGGGSGTIVVSDAVVMSLLAMELLSSVQFSSVQFSSVQFDSVRFSLVHDGNQTLVKAHISIGGASTATVLQQEKTSI